MRITEKLKAQIALAKSKGYSHIVIKKGGKYSCAIVEIPFKVLLKSKIGTSYSSGEIGRFPNKENPPLAGGIGYYDIMRLGE